MGEKPDKLNNFRSRHKTNTKTKGKKEQAKQKKRKDIGLSAQISMKQRLSVTI